MSDLLRLVRCEDRAIEIRHADGGLLFRYVYRPDTPLAESPRPYIHPLRTLAGEELTSFRPNDHPWHHGVSFTINQVAGRNFWGGPSYRPADGYQWRRDHGTQQHLEWHALSANRLMHTLEWRDGQSGEALLAETRELSVELHAEKTWSLRWHGVLKNLTERALILGNYHSSQGLTGSHYTGLQFRGARDLLDDHGDTAIGITAEGGLLGADAVHGASARWMEWHAQKDTSLGRVLIRFTNNTGPLHWFVRRLHAQAVFPFHYDRDLMLGPEAALVVDHTLSFTDAS